MSFKNETDAWRFRAEELEVDNKRLTAEVTKLKGFVTQIEIFSMMLNVNPNFDARRIKDALRNLLEQR